MEQKTAFVGFGCTVSVSRWKKHVFSLSSLTIGVFCVMLALVSGLAAASGPCRMCSPQLWALPHVNLIEQTNCACFCVLLGLVVSCFSFFQISYYLAILLSGA